MKSPRLWLLGLVLAACSQSITVTQPPTTSHFTSDTINFGTDPLWREADTTVWISFASHNAITAIIISDSNFTLRDTSRTNDSLRISLRFQPQSFANHSGMSFLISKQDTLAKLTLLGVASPFERRVGDSYIFVCTTNNSYSLDSIVVIDTAANEQPFFSSSSRILDSGLNHANILYNGDYGLNFYGPRRYLTTICVATDSEWELSGIDSSFGGHTFWTLMSSKLGDSSTHLLSSNLKTKIFQITNCVSVHKGPRTGYVDPQYNDEMTFIYSSDLHFFTAMQLHRQTSGTYIQTSYSDESYHLLRFHLRR